MSHRGARVTCTAQGLSEQLSLFVADSLFAAGRGPGAPGAGARDKPARGLSPPAGWVPPGSALLASGGGSHGEESLVQDRILGLDAHLEICSHSTLSMGTCSGLTPDQQAAHKAVQEASNPFGQHLPCLVGRYTGLICSRSSGPQGNGSVSAPLCYGKRCRGEEQPPEVEPLGVRPRGSCPGCSPCSARFTWVQWLA